VLRRSRGWSAAARLERGALRRAGDQVRFRAPEKSYPWRRRHTILRGSRGWGLTVGDVEGWRTYNSAREDPKVWKQFGPKPRVLLCRCKHALTAPLVRERDQRARARVPASFISPARAVN
jgi:hypothetical protein